MCTHHTNACKNPFFVSIQNICLLNTQLEEACSLATQQEEGALEQTIETLISQGANPFANHGQALCSAVTSRCPTILFHFLQTAQDKKAPHCYKDKALLLACKDANCQIAHMLLEHGANPNTQRGKALFYAVARNCMELVQLLFQYGIQVTQDNHSLYDDDNTFSLPFPHLNEKNAYTLAALVGQSGNTKILCILQQHGFALHAGAAADAMRNAVFASQPDMIRALWHHPFAQDAFLQASLRLAACEGRVSSHNTSKFTAISLNTRPPLETLIHEMGACYDFDDHKVLRDAAQHGHLSAVQFLLEHHDQEEQTKPDAEFLNPTLTLHLITKGVQSLAASLVFLHAGVNNHVHICSWLLDEFCQTRNAFLQKAISNATIFPLAVLRLVLTHVTSIVYKTREEDDMYHRNKTREFLTSILPRLFYGTTESLVCLLEFLDRLLKVPHTKELFCNDFLKNLFGNYLMYQVLNRDHGLEIQDLVLQWMKKTHNIFFDADDCIRILELSGCTSFSFRLKYAPPWLNNFHAHGLVSAKDVLLFANKYRLTECANKYLSYPAIPCWKTFLHPLDLVQTTGDASLVRDFFASQGRQRIPLFSMAATIAKTSTFVQKEEELEISTLVQTCLRTCAHRGYESAFLELVLHWPVSPASLEHCLQDAIFQGHKRIILLLTLYGCRLSFPLPFLNSDDFLFLLPDLIYYDLIAVPLHLDLNLKLVPMKTIMKQMNILQAHQKETFLDCICSGKIVVTYTKPEETDFKTAILIQCLKTAIREHHIEQADAWVERYKIPDEIWSFLLLKQAVLHDAAKLFEQLLAAFSQPHIQRIKLLDLAATHGRLEMTHRLLSLSSPSYNMKKQVGMYQTCLKRALVSGNVAVFYALVDFLGPSESNQLDYFLLHSFSSRVSDPGILDWTINTFLASLDSSSSSDTNHFFAACISVARKSATLCERLLFYNSSQTFQAIFYDEYQDALARVFALLDKRGVLECMRIFAKILSRQPNHVHERQQVLCLFLKTCSFSSLSSLLSPSLSSFSDILIDLVKPNESKLSDTTIKCIFQHLEIPQGEFKAYLPPSRLARFAKQEWYAVYSVIQTLALETYHSSLEKEETEKGGIPLPLQLLEHVTTQECFSTYRSYLPLSN